MHHKNCANFKQPREKLMAEGPGALSDAELLAILLRTGTTGKPVLVWAQELLKTFGGLRPLLHCDYDTFTQQRGLGCARYVELQAALEIARRDLWSSIENKKIVDCVSTAKQFLQMQLRDLSFECFAVLFLDVQNRVQQYVDLFRGTLNTATVYVRDVVVYALKYHAHGVIFVHNHPQGCAKPSQADIDITQALKKALAMVDIHMWDHFIVGENKIISLAEMGLV